MTSDTPSVELDGVTKRFGDLVAVDDLSLELGAGEFFTLLGPSGCGKTTTLRMIAGFETAERRDDPDRRRRRRRRCRPHKRPTNTVFQSYALFPHLSVADNVAFGLQRKGVPKAEIAKRVAAELERVGLGRRGGAAPGPALRRPAAAGRAGAGPGQPAQGAAPRRAARRPRPEAAQGPAAGAEADPARGRHHLRLRHPRPGGGADDERPDRGDERRPGRAGRRPRAGLRAAGDDLRRRLHRRLQPDAGDGRRAPARCGSTRGRSCGRPTDGLVDRRALPRGRAAGEAADRAARAGRRPLRTAGRGSRASSRARSTWGRRRRSSSTSATGCG